MRLSNPFHPPPAPTGFGIGKTVPQPKASFFNQLLCLWLGPFLEVGFSRPLEKDDLWALPEARLTANTTDALEAFYFPRCPPEVRPRAYRGQPKASDDDAASETAESDEEKKGDDAQSQKKENKHEQKTKPRRFWQRKPKPEFDSSLFRAVHQTFFYRIWTGGVLKLFADTLKTTTPLLTKVILTWLTDAYVVYHTTPAQIAEAEAAGVPLPKVQGIGYGVGLACALFVMQEISSLMTNHSQQIMETIGLSVRTALIGSVFRKSLRLSARARIEHTVGQTTTIISTDSARLDRFCFFGHNIWTSPIQASSTPTPHPIIIGVGLLINNLGYSALVGLGVLLLGFPLQMLLVRVMFNQRKKGVKITDTRVRLSNEVLQGIRLIKYYAWESFYAHQIGGLREREIATVRKTAIARAALIALVALIPVLASVLSFITYALSGHELNIAIIFSSLQFFNASIIRAPLLFLPFVLTALSDAIVALGRIGRFLTAEELPDPYAIELERKNAVEVDASFAWEEAGKLDAPKFGGAGRGGAAGRGGRGGGTGNELLPTSETGTPLPSGAVTPREEEKPFELQNLKFSVPKGAFIAIVGKVGSGKSSILQALIGEMRKTTGTVVFGGTMHTCPNLRGFGTPLSPERRLGLEEDEEKFRQIIRACSLEHDLEVLPRGEETEIGERGINLSGAKRTDHAYPPQARVSLARAAYSATDIVLLDDPLSAVDSFVGKAILEDLLDKTDYIYVMDNGTIKEQGTYETLMKEGVVFSKLMEEYGNLDQEEHASQARPKRPSSSRTRRLTQEGTGRTDAAEERNPGPRSSCCCLSLRKRLKAIGNNLFLGFWTANSIHGFRQGEYMAVYAALGLAQAFFSFLTSFAFALASLMASLSLFKTALSHILRSPASFFDTTPMGRILSRLVKDQDTLDNQLSMTLMQLLTTFASVLGTVGLVFYTFPLLGIIFAPMAVAYYLWRSITGARLWRRNGSTRSCDRHCMPPIPLYRNADRPVHYRAYREQEPAIKSAEQGLDLENRAYFMTITLQLWLGLRLDIFGNILIFGIALFAAGFRHTVDPSKIGVVLSYTLSSLLPNGLLFAQNEQNMNSVERLITYAELPSEDRGEIAFKNVEMSYREGLPLVLKGVTFNVRPGEKVGIVGEQELERALFFSSLPYGRAAKRLALVPQDSVLFLGTLRENLDPQNSKTDAELISVLQRAWLLPREGSNYSAGEKQLLALCRALVKNSAIIVLDEATSSVDVETDAKLQRTIRTEFASATLLCIAHRLNTIAYYDRILVMDKGEVAEFDTVLNLYDKEDSIFRSLCNEANLQRTDILRIRAENAVVDTNHRLMNEITHKRN
ncbi:hypothetical protein K438DRAFT_1985689 [Mycena galopus ATCC 62051]|nr:hypothetical protein K438DRAFT_1985689 [Mycena galopus ATCC 62051]